MKLEPALYPEAWQGRVFLPFWPDPSAEKYLLCAVAPTEKNSLERPPETQLWKSAFPLPGEADVAVKMVQGDVCSGTGTRVYTLMHTW